MRTLKNILSEDIIAKLAEQIRIVIRIDKTKHAGERQSREAEDFISNDEIKNIAKNAIHEIILMLISNELDIGDYFVIKSKSSDLNIVCVLEEKNNLLDLIVVTVMRKKNFKPKAGTKLIMTEDYDYNSTQFDLPIQISEVEDLFKDFFNPDDIVQSDYGEDIFHEPHVTVLYGIKDDDDIEKVKNYLYKKPIELQLGEFKVFQPGDEDYDVLVVKVDSDELVDLHNKLRKNIDNDFSYPEYQPHATVAYLKRGTGKNYLMKPNPLQGRKFVVDELIFSHRNGNKTKLKLRESKIVQIKKSELKQLIKECVREVLKEGTTWRDIRNKLPDDLQQELRNSLIPKNIKKYKIRYIPTKEVFKIKGADEKTIHLFKKLNPDEYKGVSDVHPNTVYVGDGLIYLKKYGGWQLIDPHGKPVIIN